MRESHLRADWPQATLAEVAEVAAGVTLGRKLPVYGTVEMPYLRVANVQDGYLDLDEIKTVRVRPAEVDRYRLRPGDVVLSEGNANLNNLGRATIWRDEIPGCLHQNIVLRVRCNEHELLPTFLVLITTSAYARRYVRAVAKQTSIAHLGITQLERFPVPLPPLRVQQQVVEAATSAERSAAVARDRALKLVDLRRGHLEDLLAPAGSLDDTETQANWPRLPLADVADVASGVTLGRKLPPYGTVEMPYLRVANVQDGYLDLDEIKTVRVRPAEVDRYRLEPGDVLMNEGGDFDKLGRGAVWEGQVGTCLHQNHVFRVRCDHQRVLPGYLAAVCTAAYGRKYFLVHGKQSTNLASISKRDLTRFPVPLAPPSEQRRIVEILARYDASIEAERSREAKFRAIRDGLLDDLLTGRALAAA